MAIMNKIMDRVSAKLQTAGLSYRSDMQITDTLPIDSRKCKIALTYDTLCGVPTVAQVEKFIEATFNGKLHAQSASVQLHEAQSACSLLCTLHTSSRPLTDASSMVRMAQGTYLDEGSNTVWNVVEDNDTKYLVRQAEENINDIIETRKVRTSRFDAKFDGLKTAAPLACVGDQVKFMSADNLTQLGEVLKINDNTAVIKANGIDNKIDRHSIIEIVERAASNLQDEKNLLEDFFAKAYGSEEFAKELTNKISTESGLGSTVPDMKNISKK